MPLTVRHLRVWFAAALLLLVAVVAGFFFYGRYRVRKVMGGLGKLPQKYGIEVQQSANQFSRCLTEGDRTVFCVRASRMLQYRLGGKAELQDVSIIVYGRESTRYDQIYGAKFEFDPKTEIVTAAGEVRIDLASNPEGAARPDGAPPAELKNAIHLKTSGLSFNSKTGMARTAERIEFSTAQASGSAVGAEYDSHRNQLTLASQIAVHTSGRTPADLTASHGVITKEPLVASFAGVHGRDASSDFAAAAVKVYFRPDTSVERVIASGNVEASRRVSTAAGAYERAAATTGTAAFGNFRADRLEAFLTPENTLRNAVFSGSVVANVPAGRPLHAEAGRVLADFAPQNRLAHVRALDRVKLAQLAAAPQFGSSAVRQSGDSQSLELTAAAVDFDLKDGRLLDRAWTTGPAQIVIAQPDQRATITAARFDADFDERNRIRGLHGSSSESEPTRILSRTPSQPERVTTARELDVAFKPEGGVASFSQQGDFRYAEATRAATAERARYTASDEIFQLTGNPRFTDAGLSLSAETLRLNRRTGAISADVDVKATYTGLRADAQGAMLASADPVHATAAHMTATRVAPGVSPGGAANPGSQPGNSTATFSGNARLWQGPNIVEAPTIEFDRDRRTMLAQGSARQRVSTVFVQQDKAGKATPVSVTAAQLTYSDQQRTARFTGGVTTRGQDATISADRVDILLHPRTDRGAPDAPGTVQSAGQLGNPAVPPSGNAPAQLQQIIASGSVKIEESGRTAEGQKLVYTAQNGKFVLTGGPPSIFSAEHGKVTGDSLTFFSRDDRVLVESSASGRTVTRTRITR